MIENEIKKLVKDECANHQCVGPGGIKNFCLLLGICAFFSDEKIRCEYFEKFVLPLKQDLAEEYKNERIKNQDSPV